VGTAFIPRAKDNRQKPRVFSTKGKQDLNNNVWVTNSRRVKGVPLPWIAQYIPWGALPFILTVAVTSLLMFIYYTAEKLLQSF
jgi:hypothetical protein